MPRGSRHRGSVATSPARPPPIAVKNHGAARYRKARPDRRALSSAHAAAAAAHVGKPRSAQSSKRARTRRRNYTQPPLAGGRHVAAKAAAEIHQAQSNGERSREGGKTPACGEATQLVFSTPHGPRRPRGRGGGKDDEGKRTPAGTERIPQK